MKLIVSCVTSLQRRHQVDPNKPFNIPIDFDTADRITIETLKQYMQIYSELNLNFMYDLSEEDSLHNKKMVAAIKFILKDMENPNVGS